MGKEINILKKGGIGVIPTDTVYGLVGSALNKKTVERIYKIKKRDRRKPLIVLLSSSDELAKFDIDNLKRLHTYVKKWPSQVSLILPIKSKALVKWKYLHRGCREIAFRVPNSKKLCGLIGKTGPLVAPSANPEGLPTPNNIKKAKRYFKDMIDFYKSGKVVKNKPSTILRWDKDRFEVVRVGQISLSRLRKQKLIV